MMSLRWFASAIVFLAHHHLLLLVKLSVSSIIITPPKQLFGKAQFGQLGSAFTLKTHWLPTCRNTLVLQVPFVELKQDLASRRMFISCNDWLIVYLIRCSLSDRAWASELLLLSVKFCQFALLLFWSLSIYVHMMSSDVPHSGWLYKLSWINVRRSWRKRFFVLHEKELRYYRQPVRKKERNAYLWKK